MSDWYSRALQRSSPSGQQPQHQVPATWSGQPHSHVSAPTPQQQVQQQIPDEMLPAEMRWANKLVGAARNAMTNGIAHKTDTQPCPSCGSPQYFSRATSKRMPPPAPHCYNCGYNDGMFDQGLESSWVGAQP